MKSITVNKELWLTSAREATANRLSAVVIQYYDQIVDAINALKDEVELDYVALGHLGEIHRLLRNDRFMINRIGDGIASKITLRITHEDQLQDRSASAYQM